VPSRLGVGDDAVVVPLEPSFGRDIEVFALAVLAEGLADDLFGAAVAVDRRGVDQVDAVVEDGEAGGNAIVIADVAPFESADRPGSEADAGDFAAVELEVFHD
jgi:hypothetical protein